ncbi:hypothetical protein ES319_D13G031300v1 [Gossypium barbadense]|uniref:Expansin-like EG45 domain-containing protein n=1 Tax=Gossypium barbadense TaxID=3634 RepID=A0A5J5NGP7_GOSBA|nr:hypothetical protein ES319_D13G031300v1 [Gossypium barbadense]
MAKLSILLCIAIAFMLSFTLREVVAHTGTATFYTPPYVPSACNGYQKDGVMIAAASDAIWDDGAACGRKYKVKCTGATNQSPHPCRGKKYVVVKVVDYCPSGCEGTIDLSQEAFASIADPDAGEIKISFHHIACRNMTSPLRIWVEIWQWVSLASLTFEVNIPMYVDDK